MAPEGCEIRLLLTLTGGGLAHCTLPPGRVSRPLAHRTMEENWFCLTGEGEVWRQFWDNSELVPLRAGTCLTIPFGTHFQFRAVGAEPLRFLIATTPPSSGEYEAMPLARKWEPTVFAPYVTRQLPERCDYLAPDGSEIRLLPELAGGGLAHCTLPPGKVSSPVTHRTVEEIWYCISGEGEVWRKNEQQAEVITFSPRTCLTIPVGTHFQFRTAGAESLRFLILTMPPWPGPDEAVAVKGHWETT